jgi:predicted transcriptional regulator of viral defense system
MPAQRFTDTDTAVIARAHRKRRDVIVLREDRDWLQEFSSRPKDMLWRMARRGALIELGAGRYAVPSLGHPSAAYKAWQPMLHARLAPLGPYYLGFLSALIEHRLTDLASRELTVAIGFSNRQVLYGQPTVAGRAIRAVHSARQVFGEQHGVQSVELSRTELYLRSDPMRTLVDTLWHPELFGSTETWVSAWGRARRTEQLDPELMCQYGLALGPTVARRTGLMLSLIGHDEDARRLLPARVRRADRAADLVADQPSLSDAEHDGSWHVDLNVPRERLQGWLLYGK